MFKTHRRSASSGERLEKTPDLQLKAYGTTRAQMNKTAKNVARRGPLLRACTKAGLPNMSALLRKNMQASLARLSTLRENVSGGWNLKMKPPKKIEAMKWRRRL